MKRSTCFLFILLFLLGTPFYLTGSPLEEVTRSRHNLLATSATAPTPCTVCHIDAVPLQPAAPEKEGGQSAPSRSEKGSVRPLWGSSGAKPYTINAFLPDKKHPYNQPTGTSLTCLACHDGAVGTDMHGVNVEDPRLGAPASRSWKGGLVQREAPPLSRVDHPISIRYPRKPNGMFIPENPTVTLSRYWTIPDRHPEGFTLPNGDSSSYLDLPLERVSSPEILSTLVRTTSGRVECDSCHNPHSEKIRPFLRAPSATLCLICHDR